MTHPSRFQSGSELYLAFMETINLHPNRGEDESAHVMKAVARFIVSYIALHFFATVGIVYNLGFAAIKGCFTLYNCMQNNSSLHAMDLEKHLLFALKDLAIKTFSFYFSIFYSIFPRKIIQMDHEIKQIINSQSFSKKPLPSNKQTWRDWF